ncbi:MAG: tetratricopeptide repeat protein [Spirochaetales bacterium]|nr:tetratricopeptide repeat protein [Spirochaetales bacterium]
MDTIVIIILASVLFGGLGVFIFFIIRMILKPQQVHNLENLVKQGKTSQAIRTAKQILQNDPRDCETHYLLGKALLQDGKDELALMEYKTVNAISDFKGSLKESAFRREMADLYTKFDQDEEALKEYLLLIQKEPNEPSHLFMAGLIFEKRKKPVQALNYYKRTIAQDPNHSDAYMHLGMLLYAAKKENDAKVTLNKALKLNHANHQAYYYLGKIHKEQKNYSAAIEMFEKGQKDPEFKIKCLIERGICLIMIKSYDQAMTDLERVLRLVETEKAGEREILFARYFLALCYEKSRKLDQAISQWEAIYTKDKNFKDVAEKLSQFQELRSDDVMKDYMTATNARFEDICLAVADVTSHSVTDVQMVKQGCKVFVVEKNTGQWRNARKFPKLMLFLRNTSQVDLPVIREFHEDLTACKVTRGMIFAGTQFTRTAMEFAEPRPIEIYDKDKLLDLLHQVNNKGK